MDDLGLVEREAEVYRTDFQGSEGMETDGLTDYDRIAERMGDVLAELMGNAHEPRSDSGDSVMITKDGLLCAVIRLQRLRDWVEGLAESYRRGNLGWEGEGITIKGQG